MCQRVGIAIALSCDPRLLIADEPTTGLDVTTQKATMDLIRALTEERHMAVVLITHDLGMAAKYCDRIVVMEKGRVVETATVEALFSDPRHAYTKKLIAASPGPRSTLAELAPDDEAGVFSVRSAERPFRKNGCWPQKRSGSRQPCQRVPGSTLDRQLTPLGAKQRRSVNISRGRRH